MTVMVSEVPDALREASASGERSRKAAETLAQRDLRFAMIDTDLALLRWMTGFILAGVSGIIIRLLTQ